MSQHFHPSFHRPAATASSIAALQICVHEYPADWDPQSDNRTPVWEALHQLIRAYNAGGESAAGMLLARMPEKSGDIRRLAYWLYNACAERKRLPEEARAYNELITAWHAIEAASHDAGHINVQGSLGV